MRSLHNEDLEIQLKLAKLRTELQISATVCFSSLGLIGIFMIILHQSYLIIPENQTIMKYAFILTFVLMASLFFFIGQFFIKTMRIKCETITELKSQHVWQNTPVCVILQYFGFKADRWCFFAFVYNSIAKTQFLDTYLNMEWELPSLNPHLDQVYIIKTDKCLQPKNIAQE